MMIWWHLNSCFHVIMISVSYHPFDRGKKKSKDGDRFIKYARSRNTVRLVHIRIIWLTCNSSSFFSTCPSLLSPDCNSFCASQPTCFYGSTVYVDARLLWVGAERLCFPFLPSINNGKIAGVARICETWLADRVFAGPYIVMTIHLYKSADEYWHMWNSVCVVMSQHRLMWVVHESACYFCNVMTW